MTTNNHEWLNENSLRSYPIKEDLSRGPAGAQIPTNFMVDMKLVGTERTTNYYVAEIAVVAPTIFILINDSLGVNVLTFTIDSTLHSQYRSYIAEGLGELFGTVTVDRVDGILTLTPSGKGITYAESETSLEPSIFVPSDREFRVTSLGKLGVIDTLTGDVKLEQGDGILIETNEPDNALRVSQSPDPDPTPSACECPPNFPAIKTINGLPPDCDGNFCLQVGGINTLTIDGACLTIGSLLNPVEICDLGVGIPGPAGSPGGAGPPGPAGKDATCCCKVCVMVKNPAGYVVDEVPDGCVITGVSVTELNSADCNVLIIFCTEKICDLVANCLPKCPTSTNGDITLGGPEGTATRGIQYSPPIGGE